MPGRLHTWLLVSTVVVTAIAAVTIGWLTGGHGSSPLPAPTTIAGAGASVVTVTQENVSPATRPRAEWSWGLRAVTT